MLLILLPFNDLNTCACPETIFKLFVFFSADHVILSELACIARKKWGKLEFGHPR